MSAFSGRFVVIALAVTLVVAAVVGGLIILGSPADERTRRLDGTRVRDLADIGRAIDLYHSRSGSLPADLGELNSTSGPKLNVQDPDSRQPYEYKVLGPKTFELCARFQGDSPPSDGVRRDFWFHGPGRQCFRLQTEEVGR